jgi:hypothetical protein
LTVGFLRTCAVGATNEPMRERWRFIWGMRESIGQAEPWLSRGLCVCSLTAAQRGLCKASCRNEVVSLSRGCILLNS